MTTAAFLLLRHASENREQWLSTFYEIGKEAMRPEPRGGVNAFIIAPADNSGLHSPPHQRTGQDRLIDTLDRGEVEIEFPGTFTVNRRRYPQGTAVIRMAQPYGGFAKALLEAQRYPDLRDASGHPQQPYDVTAHTLSLLMGVPVTAVHLPLALPKPRPEPGRGWNGGCGDAPGGRRALYRSHSPAMDEGWTRWVLENHGWCLYYTTVTDSELRKGNLRPEFDTFIIPDQSATTILNGFKEGTMPSEFTGGMGQTGVKALREFVEQGGTLVCLNRASTFAIEQFKLPVRDVVAATSEKEFFVPGSILRIELDTTHPIARGMPRETIAWVEDSPVFEVLKTGNSNQIDASNVRIIARYPSERNPLLSGWLLGESRIRGKAALLEVTVGKGRIFLFGFRPQYRGQSTATYPLFFNAITRK
jgi:hypothetical protein